MRLLNRLKRRHALLLLAAGAAVPAALIAQRRPSLFVFVPSMVRARALVGFLEQALPGVEVVAFGRFADFTSAVESLQPTAVLSLQESLRAIGLAVDLKGTGHGDTSEPYVVLTHKRDVTLGTLGSYRLGAVDVVGRRALPKLVQDLLDLSSRPQVRRVLMLSDLLPLLSLDLADAIVLPARLVEPLAKTSRLELRVLRPSARLGCAAVAFRAGPPVEQIRNGLRRLSSAALDALGIDGWQEQEQP